MNKQDNKVLACVDRSSSAPLVTDHAAWVAERLQSPLELLHMLDRQPAAPEHADHSGAIGADAQEHLLQALSDDDARHARAEREAARVWLRQMRDRAQAAGVGSVDTRLRRGELHETLSEHQAGVSMFVMGRQGACAQGSGGLGRQVEWTVRSLQRPVLVASTQFRPLRRVLLAFDGSAITRQGVDMVARSPLFAGLTVHVVMSGKPTGDAPRQIEWARRTLEASGLDVQADVLPGDPHAVMVEAIGRRAIDLLVMGAYAHSPWRALWQRSRTTELLRAVHVPALLLR